MGCMALAVGRRTEAKMFVMERTNVVEASTI